MKTLVGIVVLVVVVGGVYYLNDVTRNEDGTSLLHVAPPVEIQVNTAPPEVRRITRIVQAPGEIEAIDEVDISAEVVAKILEMPVEEGDTVELGQLLCRLDDADFRARVRSAEAAVERLNAQQMQRQAEFDKAKRDCDRQARLSEANATSNVEMADYHTRLVQARAALDMCVQSIIEAEAALQSAREDLAKTVITAPLTGVISQLFAEQGEVVVTGTMNNPGTRIMVISDLSKLQVRCRVDEGDAPLVANGQPARVYLQSDTYKSVAGEVLRVATKGTKVSGRDVVTFETLVLITGDDPRVKPGMTANVEIETASRDGALTVPVEAVVYRRNKDVPDDLFDEEALEAVRSADDGARKGAANDYLKLVFCVENGKAVPHLVQTGISDAVGVEVLAGVTAEAQVITGPYRSLDRLEPGTTVTVNTPAKAENETEDAEASANAEPADPNDETTEAASTQNDNTATESNRDAGQAETTAETKPRAETNPDNPPSAEEATP